MLSPRSPQLLVRILYFPAAVSMISVIASVTDPAEMVSVAPLITSGFALPLSTIAFAHSAAVSSLSLIHI